MRESIVANFGADLECSHNMSGEPAWAEYYKRLFPDLAAAVRLDRDSPLQRHGIDRILHFGNGLQLTVDEKIRPFKNSKVYDDVLLELYSDRDRKMPGWTIDPQKTCDYIAYAIPKLTKCYFLPYPLLRNAFTLLWQTWAVTFKGGNACDDAGRRYVDSQNEFNGRKWITRNIGVAWGPLRTALCQQMHRRYSGNLVLPTPKVQEAETTDYQLSLRF